MQLGKQDSEFDTLHEVPPHVRLWAAVVRRAALDVALYVQHPRAKLRGVGVDAKRWLTRQYEQDVDNSLTAVAACLGLPAEVLASKALSLTSEEARRQRGMEFGDG